MMTAFSLLSSLERNSVTIVREVLNRLNMVGTLMHRPFLHEEEGQDFALINRFFFNGEKHNHNWESAFSGIFGILIMDHYL